METTRNYDIILVGEKITNPDDDTKSKIDYIQTTDPSASSREAGFGPQDYLHCQLKERVAPGIIGGNRRYYTETLFQNSDSSFFDLIKAEIVEGNYEVIKGTDDLKIKLNAAMPGTIRTFATGFKYTPMNRNEDGKEQPLKANPRLHDGSFEKDWNKRPNVVKNTSQIFIPEADMDSSDAIIASEAEKLKKWSIEEKTVITQKTKIEETPTVN